MRSTAELRVPTVPVAVEISGIGVAPSPCEVFVPDVQRAGRNALADDLAALLESDPPFLPVRIGPTVSLFGKHAIHWLALAMRIAGEEPDAPKPAAADGVPAEVTQPEPSDVLTLFDSKHDVEVTLVDGSTLSGAILHTSPADRPRVADYLNRAARFIRLWTPRAQYMINKAHVTCVREVD
jgi:hypothetical protein